MLRTIAIFLSCCCLTVLAAAQSAPLPKSNIYLFQIEQGEDGSLSFNEPRYLTAFNPNGVNNHPAFFSKNELYFTSMEPGDAQADLYKFDLENLTRLRVTETPETEMAPARMPEYYTFSAVRIEQEGRENRYKLWQFPIDQLTNGKPVFKYINGIQEYLWLNSREIVIYKEEDPSTLAIVNTNNDDIQTIATNVGRCMRILPNGNLAYVQKDRYEDWKIMEKNLFRRRDAARTIIETLPSAEYFAVLPNGTLVMGKGSKIYTFNKFTDDNWKEAADLRFYEIKNISRIVVSEDFKMVIVAD